MFPLIRPFYVFFIHIPEDDVHDPLSNCQASLARQINMTLKNYDVC